MPTNIEKLQKRVEETKTQIEQSKELSTVEKIQKAKALESVISKIKSDLDALRVSATPEELEEIKALESSYEEMNNQFKLEFKQEFSSLEEEVIDSAQEEKNKKEEREKSWFKKKRDKIPEGGQKALKIAGGITGAVLLFKGIKRLFGGKKEKNNTEKKGFWNRGIGKALKRVGIGVGGFLGIKWLMKYFDKEKDPNDDSVDQYSGYLNLQESSPEKYNQYEQVGTEINSFYGNAWSKEKELFNYKDESPLGKVGDNVEEDEKLNDQKTAGLVPRCIDGTFGNIGILLSKKGLRRYNRNDSIEKYKNEIKSWGKDKIREYIVPYLVTVGSWVSFGFKSEKSIEAQLDEYLADNSEEKLKELQLFFKQYSKVLTYVADKNNELERKIAINILKKKGYKNSADSESTQRTSDPKKQKELLENAMDDGDWVEKNIESHNTYKDFRASNILGASKVLEKEGILSDNISPELQNIVSNLDEQTEKILGGGKTDSALFIAEEKLNIGESLDGNTKKGVLDICNNFSEDMQDGNGEGFFQNNFNYIFDLFDFDDEARKEYIEKTGLGGMFTEYETSIASLKEEIRQNPTKENIGALKEVIGEYIAMKKEVMLAVYGIQSAKENAGGLDLAIEITNSIATMFEKFYTSFRETMRGHITLGNSINLILGLAVVGTGLKVISPLVPTRVGRKLVNATGSVMQFGAKAPIKLVRISVGKIGVPKMGMAKRIRSLKTPAERKRLLKYLIYNGDLDPKRWYNHNIIEEVFDFHNKNLSKMSGGEIINTIDGEAKGYGKQIYKYRNDKNLKTLFMKKDIKGKRWQGHKILAREKSSIFSFDEDVLKKIKSIDTIAEANPKLTAMLNKIKTIEDLNSLEKFSKNSEFLKKIEKLKPTQLKKLARSIGKLDTVAEFDDILKGVSDGVINAVEDLPNDILKTIDEDVVLLRNSKLASTNQSAIVNNQYIDKKIVVIENLKKELSVGKDLDTFNLLKSNGIRSRHMADLLLIKKTDEGLYTELLDKMKKGDASEYLKRLNKKKGLKVATETISKFKRIDASKLMKNSDDIYSGLKSMIKFLSRIT